MLLQPEKIVLVRSDVSTLEAGEVPIPSGSIVHFDTDLGWFRFLQQDGSLYPRCKDDHVLSGMLSAAIRQTPGSGSARYDLVTWTASSRLVDGVRNVICKDRFVTWSELSVFALGVAEEVFLGSIHRMRVFTP